MKSSNRLFILVIPLLLFVMVMVGRVAYAAIVDVTIAEMTTAEEQATTATELLVFRVNRVVPQSDHGFPRDQPPISGANGNWYTPDNYAEGTFYYRAQIRSQPVAQNMKLQFCAWQDSLNLESCGSMNEVRGTAGTVVAWSERVEEIWKKNGIGVDWHRPRQRYGLAIKNAQGQPVSDHLGWNWNGENPAHWYPLDLCFQVVVVAKGSSFSGWQNYTCGGGGGNPTPTPTTSQPTPTHTPTPLSTPGPTPTATPSGNPCAPVAGNVVQNHSFESDLRDWHFNRRANGRASATGGAQQCTKAARIQINKTAPNTQLYQRNLPLAANSRYRFTFAAYSSSGNDIGVYLHKHGTPNTNYGLSVHQINLQQGWQTYTVDFTTRGFSGQVTDGRLRFWLAPYARPGDSYWFDAVSLVKIGAAAPGADMPNDDEVVTLPDRGLLINVPAAEFDPAIVEQIDAGNQVEEETEIQELFLPAIMN